MSGVAAALLAAVLPGLIQQIGERHRQRREHEEQRRREGAESRVRSLEERLALLGNVSHGR